MSKELNWIRNWVDEKIKCPDCESTEDLIVYIQRNFVPRKSVDKLYKQYEIMATDILGDIKDLKEAL